MGHDERGMESHSNLAKSGRKAAKFECDSIPLTLIFLLFFHSLFYIYFTYAFNKSNVAIKAVSCVRSIP